MRRREGEEEGECRGEVEERPRSREEKDEGGEGLRGDERVGARRRRAVSSSRGVGGGGAGREGTGEGMREIVMGMERLAADDERRWCWC